MLWGRQADRNDCGLQWYHSVPVETSPHYVWEWDITYLCWGNPYKAAYPWACKAATYTKRGTHDPGADLILIANLGGGWGMLMWHGVWYGEDELQPSLHQLIKGKQVKIQLILHPAGGIYNRSGAFFFFCNHPPFSFTSLYCIKSIKSFSCIMSLIAVCVDTCSWSIGIKLSIS